MDKSPYTHDQERRERDNSRDDESSRGDERGDAHGNNNNNKRHRGDAHDGRESKRAKQDYSNKNIRGRHPQPSQEAQFRNSNKNQNKSQEHGKARANGGGGGGGSQRTKTQIDHIVEDNRRLKAELNALKASIAQGDISTHKSTSVQLSHHDAVAQLPPTVETLTHVALYTPFTVPGGFPELPPVANDNLHSAVFKHKSIYSQHRDGADGIITYEKLEYLGDAYLELFASRLIYHRFPTLAAGQMSQSRETLVKNETLAAFSKAYGFDKKVEVDKSVKAQMEQDKANKGFNKVLGDVFEAYVAAVVLSHEDGFAAAEKWLTALWAPKALELFHAHKSLLIHTDDANPLNIFDPNATQELSNKLGNGRGCKLEYKPLDTIELKGDRLGQNLWIVNLSITGYGYTSKLLATGQGSNQKEAKAWAAIKAMHGKNKSIVQECEAKCRQEREARKAEKEVQAKQESSSQSRQQIQLESDPVKNAS